MNNTNNLSNRFYNVFKSALATGLKTSLFLIKIMVPVSLIVSLLKWFGIMVWIADLLAPTMRLIGLPGEAALVVVTSILLNIYSAIAVIESLPLGMREIIILAIMCLTAHNFPIEITVMKKSGSSAIKMIFLRITTAIILALVFNMILPHKNVVLATASNYSSNMNFWPMIAAWALSTLFLVIKVSLIVFGIMLFQRFAEEFSIMTFLSKGLTPLMRFFGLSDNSSFLWIVANVVGYAYGAGVIVEQVKNGKMTRQEGDLFNHHACISHSLFEDTALFLALGVPIFWITIPRLIAAFIVVWLERLRRIWFKNSFKVGTV